MPLRSIPTWKRMQNWKTSFYRKHPGYWKQTMKRNKNSVCPSFSIWTGQQDSGKPPSDIFSTCKRRMEVGVGSKACIRARRSHSIFWKGWANWRSWMQSNITSRKKRCRWKHSNSLTNKSSPIMRHYKRSRTGRKTKFLHWKSNICLSAAITETFRSWVRPVKQSATIRTWRKSSGTNNPSTAKEK